MASFDDYTKVLMVLCSTKKPMGAEAVRKAVEATAGCSLSRKRVQHLLDIAEEEYGITWETATPKYRLDASRVKPRLLLTNHLLAAVKEVERTAYPVLSQHARALLEACPGLAKFQPDAAQPAEVHSIPQVCAALHILTERKQPQSVKKLAQRLCLYMEACSPKQARRLAERELPRIFGVEVTGDTAHTVLFSAERQCRPLDFFSPEELLALYRFYGSGEAA